MIDKQTIAANFDRTAAQRSGFFQRNRIYHDQIINAVLPLMPDNARVLELGCSTGDLLNALSPGEGVGVDLSPRAVEIARQQYPAMQWLCADAEALPSAPPLDKAFDVIVMSDLEGYVYDIQQMLEHLRRLTHPATTLVISHWNWLWEPILRVAESLRLKSPDLHVRYNWLSPSVLDTLLCLAGYETVRAVSGLLVPYPVPLVAPAINLLSNAPLLNRLGLVRMVIARPAPQESRITHCSVTVVIPTRNEVGNIEAAVRRTPQMGTQTELLFIDGNSTDGTVEKIHEEIAAHPELDIKFMPQVLPTSPDANRPPDLMLRLGKGDAVRKAFAAASGDILMILDSDLTMPPEELPRFYEALVRGRAHFINGTRMVYPQEKQAMPVLNRLGNVFFSLAFTWLLGQSISDTLCGTKALWKRDYETIAANRAHFGDFDLLFGAAWLGVPIIDLPVHYHARTYGETKVRVGLHGPLLGRMSLLALWRFKIQPLFSAKRPIRVTSRESRVVSRDS